MSEQDNRHDRQRSIDSIYIEDEDDNDNESLNITNSNSNVTFPSNILGNNNSSNNSNNTNRFLNVPNISNNSMSSPISESILPNNNFTTSELLSMKHALAVHNNSANNNNNNNNNNMTNAGRRSRSSSFYTMHTNNSNSHLNNFLNNNGNSNEVYLTTKTSPMSNEHRPSIDGSVTSANNTQTNNNNGGNNNPLYGVISSPNSTKSITAASQLINDLLNSNNSSNILQTQQRPEFNQLPSTSSVPMITSSSRNGTLANSNSASRPQLQNIITSESGLRAISENNSKVGSKNPSANVSRRNSEHSLLDIANGESSNSTLERIPFNSIEGNYKHLRSPNREAFDTSTIEFPTTPGLEKRASTSVLETINSSNTNNNNSSSISRKSSITGHSYSSMTQISNFTNQIKPLTTPSSRHSQQSSQNPLLQNNSQLSTPLLGSKTGLLQHQQYSINEKQYLKKIKQSQQQNDYYNKSIFDSSIASLEDNESPSTEPNSAEILSDLQTPTLHRASSLKDSYFVKQSTKKLERQPLQNQQSLDSVLPLDDRMKKQRLNSQQTLSANSSASVTASSVVNSASSKGKKHRLKNKLEKTSDLRHIDQIYLKELDKVSQHYKNADIHKLSFLSDGDEDYHNESFVQPNDKYEIQKKIGKENLKEDNERLTWQLMLTRVLTGDIVTKEKSKLKDLKENASQGDKTNFKNELWLELKSWMNGQTLKEHKKTLELLRNSVADEIFESVTNFKRIDNISVPEFTVLIGNIVDNYEKVTSYWNNLTEMYEEKPITNTPQFREKINFFNSWLNCSSMINNLLSKISKNVHFNEAGDDYEIQSEYIEKIVKEENIQEIFQEFYNLQSQTIFKSNLCIHLYNSLIQELNMPVDFAKLRLIVVYSPKLIQKVILSRIHVANNLANPTMMMLDQIIDDLVYYIKLATEIKTTINNISMISTSDMCSGIDDSIKLAINHVYEIIVLKLETKGIGLFSSTKDTDEILEQWEVFRNLGCFLGEEYGFIIAFMFLKLFLQLMMKLHVFTYLKFKSLPSFKKENEASEWILNSLETFGSFERRFSRFFGILSSSLRNQINFKCKDQTKVIDKMVDNGYALVYTGGDLEDQGFYCFVSEELILKDEGNIKKETILKSLNNSYICSNLVPNISMNKTLAFSSILYQLNEDCEVKEEDYYEPQNKIYWEKVNKNGIQCQDLNYDDSVGDLFTVFNGVKLPLFLYSKNEGNDIKVTDYKDINYLVKNTNILNDYKALKKSSNLFGSDLTVDENSETLTSNADTDLTLKISEAILRGTGHVVLLKPKNPLLWEGNALYLETPINLNELYMFQRSKKEYKEGNDIDANDTPSDEIYISPPMKECDFIVFTEASPISSDYLLDKVLVQFGNDNLDFINKSSSINIVEKLLRKTSKIAFNFHETIITSYPVIQRKINKKFRGLQTINNGYLFCRDLAKEFVGVKENYIEKNIEPSY